MPLAQRIASNGSSQERNRNNGEAGTVVILLRRALAPFALRALPRPRVSACAPRQHPRLAMAASIGTRPEALLSQTNTPASEGEAAIRSLLSIESPYLAWERYQAAHVWRGGGPSARADHNHWCNSW